MISAVEALTRLKDGNRRYLSGAKSKSALDNQKSRHDLAKGQTPIAVVVGCSDSRVPPEIIFDQNLGDLFVIRVAGNISGASQIASVEFAVERFGCNLVIVLGHTKCGAVNATINAIANPGAPVSSNMRSIADRVASAILPTLEEGGDPTSESVVTKCVLANIQSSLETMIERSSVLQRSMQQQGFLITGALYSLETGVVSFIDG